MSDDWKFQKNPPDLRERLFRFGRVIVRVVQFLAPLEGQSRLHFLKCGTSAANSEEADDGSSDRDILAKRKVALREIKETRFRLRALRECE
jgi:hypothetical protein